MIIIIISIIIIIIIIIRIIIIMIMIIVTIIIFIIIISGLECRGEECIVDQTALPGCCSQPGACKGVPGTCRSKRSTGGTEVERNWQDWSDWGPCSAACGLGTRTRLRSAIGEEGFQVENGDCEGECSDDNENTNAI